MEFEESVPDSANDFWLRFTKEVDSITKSINTEFMGSEIVGARLLSR